MSVSDVIKIIKRPGALLEGADRKPFEEELEGYLAARGLTVVTLESVVMTPEQLEEMRSDLNRYSHLKHAHQRLRDYHDAQMAKAAADLAHEQAFVRGLKLRLQKHEDPKQWERDRAAAADKDAPDGLAAASTMEGGRCDWAPEPPAEVGFDEQYGEEFERARR